MENCLVFLYDMYNSLFLPTLQVNILSFVRQRSKRLLYCDKSSRKFGEYDARARTPRVPQNSHILACHVHTW